jgi:predicted phosphoribosyltransferase
MHFRDRSEAGRLLAQLLRTYADYDNVIVLALPRGGVPVAYEVATALGAPLDVVIVRKLRVPRHEELAIGAIASGGIVVLDASLIRKLKIQHNELRRTIATEFRELERREPTYRVGRSRLDLRDRTVILVEDGLATGLAMRAAAHTVRRHQPNQIIVAVPVAAEETCDEFRNNVDDIVCALTPRPFHTVGLWYEDFSQTSHAEVRALLARAAAPVQALS